jgi:hypothetical protein
MSPGTSASVLDVLLALELVDVAGLERLLAVADEELRVLGDRALVHAEHGDLADVRIHDHLEDVGEDVLLRDRARRGTPRLRYRQTSRTAADCPRSRWGEPGQDVEELHDSRRRLRRGEQTGIR